MLDFFFFHFRFFHKAVVVFHGIDSFHFFAINIHNKCGHIYIIFQNIYLEFDLCSAVPEFLMETNNVLAFKQFFLVSHLVISGKLFIK